MKLRFYARDDVPVYHPEVPKRSGQPAYYVGRRYDLAKGGYPATETGEEIESDSEAGVRLMMLCKRDQSLWPADKVTAEACGVEFSDVEFVNNAWVLKASKAPSKSAGKP